MNKAKRMSESEGKSFLRQAFAAEQEVLQLQLMLSNKSITHNGVMGDVNESHVIEVLRKYLPNRYAVERAIIIDSNGKTSDQIDIVIYDPQYTPTLLDQKNHRYVPAESVYAVFEVKPTINKDNLVYAANKAESVRKLERTSVPIAHAGGQYPKKKPFKIVSGIIASSMEWKEGFSGKSFRENHSELKDDKAIDCGLSLESGCFDVFDGELALESQLDNSLGYFIFRLLKHLNSLGTVPAVDWNKYAMVMKEPSSK